jgi:hypothetical protein
MNRRQIQSLAAVAVVTSLVALPAVAGEWVVELNNGTTFTSRYQPEAASWDAQLVLFTTAEGNLVALHRDDVASVRADVETRGFGVVIDDKTISLGISANDLPEASEASSLSPEMALLQELVRGQQQPQRDYSVQQFVDPSSAGVGGVPAYGLVTGGAPSGSLGGGGSDVFLPVPAGGVTAPPSTALPPPQATSLPAQAPPGQ